MPFRNTESAASSVSSLCSERLARAGLLRPDLSAEDAAGLLWLLTRFDGFDVLYTGRGLPLDEVVDVLTTTAERSLYR